MANLLHERDEVHIMIQWKTRKNCMFFWIVVEKLICDKKFISIESILNKMNKWWDKKKYTHTHKQTLV